MVAKVTVAVLGLGVLLLAGTLLYFGMDEIAQHYKETNARWRITGLCINAKNGTPVKAALIRASFTEPVTFKHHWRNPPPLATTNVITKTDEQGRFEVAGVGGSVYINAQAEGYRKPEPWEHWSSSTRDGVSYVDTNITLRLESNLKSPQ